MTTTTEKTLFDLSADLKPLLVKHVNEEQAKRLIDVTETLVRNYVNTLDELCRKYSKLAHESSCQAANLNNGYAPHFHSPIGSLASDIDALHAKASVEQDAINSHVFTLDTLYGLKDAGFRIWMYANV